MSFRLLRVTVLLPIRPVAVIEVIALADLAVESSVKIVAHAAGELDFKT